MENQAGQETEAQKRKLEGDATDANDTPSKKARVEESGSTESAVPGAATVETPASDAAKTDNKSPAKPAATRKYVYRDDDDDSDSLEYKDDENDEDFAFGEDGEEDDSEVSEHSDEDSN